MAKKRVYEIAKQLNISNRELIDMLKEIGIDVNNHMSSVDEKFIGQISDMVNGVKNVNTEKEAEKEASENVKAEAEKQNNDSKKAEQHKQQEHKKNNEQKNERDQKKSQNQRNDRPNQNMKSGDGGNFNKNKNGKNNGKNNNQQQNNNQKNKKNNKNNKNMAKPVPAPEPVVEEEDEIRFMEIPESLTVKELAEKIGKSGAEIVKCLMKRGIMAAINQTVDFDTAVSVGEEYNVIFELEKEKDIFEEAFKQEEEDESLLEARPPVVVVMGHVDHGKTSLLDAIRHSHVTSREAGGITQHIGAYTVQINGSPITFLDTPGHEAFTAMRMRGAQITDIAVLVVAADDGVMPQTVEAINHAKAAGVEVIVAINKMDKPSANPERVKQELVEYGLIAEDWGGETICVPVSAATKDGIDTLLEMIILTAEMKELKANPNKPARGAIIEAQLDKGRGPLATVLVQEGTLNIGDPIVD